MKKGIFFGIMVVLLCNPDLSWSQTEPDAIKLEENKFQEYFYEALKQKATARVCCGFVQSVTAV